MTDIETKAREWCEKPENSYVGEQAAFIAGAELVQGKLDEAEQRIKEAEELIKQFRDCNKPDDNGCCSWEWAYKAEQWLNSKEDK